MAHPSLLWDDPSFPLFCFSLSAALEGDLSAHLVKGPIARYKRNGDPEAFPSARRKKDQARKRDKLLDLTLSPDENPLK